MGGSGGGGGDYQPTGGGGGGGPEPQPNCAGLMFPTTLEQPHGVPERRRGTVLELVPTPAQGGTVVVAIDDDGNLVGTVVDDLPNLLRCLDAGWAFVAEVVTVNYGIHSVVVRPAVIDERPGAFGSPPGSADAGPLVLAGSDALDVAIGSVALDRPGIAELRSLVRSGAEIEGEASTGGSATVWFAGP